MIVSNDYNQSFAKVQEPQSCWASIQHQEIQSIEMQAPFLGHFKVLGLYQVLGFLGSGFEARGSRFRGSE